ncbi:MAG: hypothetical protein A2Z16_07615 [Chloroflexi bacterium RBG_16_54_18]|nr:MAG: hypothetical protein A2Z16_07615 [Chloroflexi bacterium RBG_16_54_18]
MPQELLQRVSRQAWWKSFPFLLALLVLVFMAGVTSRLITYPNDGIKEFKASGEIEEIEAFGPADGFLLKDDQVIEIDGEKWEQVLASYGSKSGDDVVVYKIQRNGQTLEIPLTLDYAAPPDIFLSIVPILIASIFLFVGIGVQAFKPVDVSADVFYAWCLTCATALTAGAGSYVGPSWVSSLFNSLLSILGPLSVHFHLFFPQAWPLKGRRIVIWALYILGLLGIAPFLLLSQSELRLNRWYPVLLNNIRIFLVFNLLLVFGLLVYNYFRPHEPGVRGRIRLVAFGSALSVLLFVSLTIIPEMLFHEPLVSYNFAFLFIGLVPLTYGYAIFRLHLIEIERHVNRGATYLLVYSILGSIYLLLFWVAQSILDPFRNRTLVIDTILILVMVSLFVPLRSSVQKVIDKVFYGGWYDYRLGINQITQGLELATSLEMLATSVSQRLLETLRLEETCVFLRDAQGDFSVIQAAFPPGLSHPPSNSYPILPRSSLTYLLRLGVVERKSLLHSLAELAISPEELQLLQSEQIHLWVPVIGRGQILGLLALGPKVGGDVFSSDDMDILRVAAREIGPIIENLHLVSHLRDHAADLEQRVHERTAELFNAKERVEAILASVGEGVVVTDLDGKITTVNAAFENQSGYTEAEVAGQYLQRMISNDGNADFQSEIEAALVNGLDWSGEVVGQRKTGDVYDIQLTISPVRDQSGHIVGYVSSQRDITRQKELDRMKDMFIADVSHELRTPTTNISLYLDLLHGAAPEKWPQYMRVVKDQSHQLAKLVDDILDLSRLARARAQKIEFSLLDINTLVEQVIIAHQPLADASGVKMKFTPCLPLPSVRGEPNQLARMVTNLISNALRYTLQGEVNVRILNGNSQVCIEVSDTGVGIDKEDLPHIFDRFYRGSNVRQSNIHGTGLGLAIVKEIADLHGGKIEVKSTLNKGSNFRVHLSTEKTDYAG